MKKKRRRNRALYPSRLKQEKIGMFSLSGKLTKKTGTLKAAVMAQPFPLGVEEERKVGPLHSLTN